MSPGKSLPPEKLKRLKSQAQSLEPIVRIGKNGLTPTVINQVSLALKKHGLVKVKLLRSFTEGTDRKKASQDLALGTGSMLVQCVGLVAVLYRPIPSAGRHDTDRSKNRREKLSQGRR